MAFNRDIKTANVDNKTGSPERLTSPQENKLQYEEVTTFGDQRAKDGPFVLSSSDSDGDSEAYQNNPFLDSDLAERWAIIYEKSQYECRHAFDPTFTWTKEEEKKLVRRLDLKVCLWAVRTWRFFIKKISY
jgi:hypothetical protein